MIIMVLLICYSLPHIVTLTPVTYGENLTHPAPEVGESWADLRLPFYTPDSSSCLGVKIKGNKICRPIGA